ncbi:hypothetical protein H072_5413 [Dactylellina haptotyla CBS 200.50]|uniref:Uncharacterized protein n=1 Tax=Dactylellina haptotyla (strain CBS 200.50) TaxID=1284197 RepID=S8ACS4_DACHA|nr:hypothetical protein H072_5413 [Dactylellina haptotyla CBS 200.50]
MKLIDYLEAHSPPSLVIRESPTREVVSNAVDGHRCPELGEWRNFWGEIQAIFNRFKNREFKALKEAREGFLWNNRLHRNVSSGRDVQLAVSNIVGRPVGEILGRVFGIDAGFGDARVTVKVGDPDRVLFALREQPDSTTGNCIFFNEALLAIEVKVSWTLDLKNLRALYNEELRDARMATDNTGQSELLRAVAQVYAYMVVNNLAYGALTTYDSTYFFHLFEDGGKPRFEVSPEVKQEDNGYRSLVAAFVGVSARCWLDLRHSPGVPGKTQTLVSGAPKPVAANPKAQAVAPDQNLFKVPVTVSLDNGFDLFTESGPGLDRCFAEVAVTFERFISRNLASTSHGSLIYGQHTKAVILKVYDLSSADISRVCEKEIEIHSALSLLQGTHIPKLWAIGTLWGLFKIIAMEPCGVPVPTPPSLEFYEQAPKLISAVHSQGVVHGDFALRNFTVSEGNKYWLIDFNSSRRGNLKDFQREQCAADEQLRRMKAGYIIKPASSITRTSKRATKL